MDHGGVEVHRIKETNIAGTHSTVPIGGLAEMLYPSSPFIRNGHQIITTGPPKVQIIAFPLLRTQKSKLMIISDDYSDDYKLMIIHSGQQK